MQQYLGHFLLTEHSKHFIQALTQYEHVVLHPGPLQYGLIFDFFSVVEIRIFIVLVLLCCSEITSTFDGLTLCLDGFQKLVQHC